MAPASGDAVPRNTLVTDAIERVRDLIVTGRLAPGSPIIETSIATTLGVQRSHLRQALQHLRHAGFVVTSTIGTYSRTHVAPLTAEDVHDLFGIVGAIEGLAARTAALLPATRRAQLARELERVNAKFRAAAAAKPADHNLVNDLDVAFHRQYVEGVASARVRVLHDAVKPQADRYERFYTNALLDDIAVSADEHDAIVEAIRSGDPDAAQRAVETNWRNAAERFARVIAVAGERGQLQAQR